VADEVEEIEDDEVEAGNVVKTDPPEGNEVKKNSVVTLYISSGIKKITLDDYEGRSFEEVKEELIDLGFDEDNIKSELEESDDVSEGDIISQSPAAGREISPVDGEITFKVSSGPDTFEMLNLIGLTEAEARAELTSRGVDVARIISTPQTSDEPEGTVVGQTPNSGEAVVTSKTAITLFISSGPQMTNVPTVIGLTQSEAEAAVRRAGLTPNTNREYDDSVPEGQVISVSPEEGSSVVAGSQVTLTISRGPEQDSSSTTQSSSSDDSSDSTATSESSSESD
jgi:serine/threonine-protein kinase